MKHTNEPWRIEQTKGWGGDWCILAGEASKPIFKAIKPDTYYTVYPKGRTEGSVILSTELAKKQGLYVATDEICKDIDNVEFETARRIVTCVNACAGLQTNWLEDKGFKDVVADIIVSNSKLQQQRDELLAALKKIESETAATWVCDVARDAISKAEATS